MQLDEELCYSAVRSRDARFDGRFFTAVTTTGVYCRPICPARTPKRKHVRFYVCAAAAEEAGFRPCRRCRPDTAPGSPAWIGTSATVVRGLRCIADGALDTGPVDALALRLGLGERQLRRLFLRHVGATPATLARTRRVHFARQLIDETLLPMTEVAFAAGFTSLRQFNASVKETFGQTPTALRARASKPSSGQVARGAKVSESDASVSRTPQAGASAGEWLSLRLPYRPPYDWDALIGFLASRAIPGVEQITPVCYARGLELEGVARRVEVRPVPGSTEILFSVQPPVTRGLVEMIERVRALFDLDADPLPIREQLRQGPVLGPLMRARPGLRVPGAWNGFELSVRAILGQQVTVAGATTLAGRLARMFGTRWVPGLDGITHRFPGAEQLAEADLARIGLPRARAEALRALARQVALGRVVLTPSADPEETRARLLELPGLGPWTVEYIAMRALRDPDAFPAGDLGLRRALATGAALLTPEAVTQIASSWRPWRAYAAMHLWASLAPHAGLRPRRKHDHPH